MDRLIKSTEPLHFTKNLSPSPGFPLNSRIARHVARKVQPFIRVQSWEAGLLRGTSDFDNVAGVFTANGHPRKLWKAFAQGPY